MSEYYVPEELDITKVYLKNVFEKKAPKLGELHALFDELNIDRVLQGFIDGVTEPENVTSQEGGVFLAGQVDMGKKIKQFLSNLGYISKKVAEGNIDVDDLTSYTDQLSGKDIALAEKLTQKQTNNKSK